MTPSLAQTHDRGFRIAVPGYQYEFPRDHGSHPDFRLEWWYYTGHLTTASGRELGFEVTFFRVGVVPPQTSAATEWDLRHLAFAHFAITDVDRGRFRFHEKINRLNRYLAGAATTTLDVFNESWRVRLEPDGSFRLRAAVNGDAVDLVMRPLKPPVIHGESGISVKGTGEGNASHYYSMTRLQVSGSVTADGKRESCTGLAWMDHEFSTSALRDNQAGWDWFSIQLDDNTELMLYQMRRRDGSADANSSGTFVFADGKSRHLKSDEFLIEPRGSWKSPHTGAIYPMGWRVRVPQLGIDLTLKEKLRDQELITTESTRVTYWEGAVGINGDVRGKRVTGSGYVEMSGYDQPLALP